jgi:UDP-N-acetylglucosamine 1-carboxyvinyltransferase
MVLSNFVPEVSLPTLKIHGGRALQGDVQISGSKNAALVLIAATLLCPEDCCLENVPQLTDVEQLNQLLMALGAKLKRCGTTLTVNASDLQQADAPAEIVRQLRASFFVIGPLLARLGVANVPLPGGCAIGARPVDLHLQGLRAMGADITVDQGVVSAVLQVQRLRGATIHLTCPSVGATETLLMAATLADGETVIHNAAREPEVVDLAHFCQAMGAQIRGAGTSTLVISGVTKLHSATHRVIPDRIEAGTFLAASAITRSPLRLTAVNPKHLRSVVEELWSIGATVYAEAPDRLQIIPAKQPLARMIKTRPYPGFPTDMQPQFMALLSTIAGDSLISEMLFENRFQHVAELNRLGANIQLQGNRALIRGGAKLVGTSVTATDLRASAALVLAGLVAEGTTIVHNLHYLDRGYENLEQKFCQLGAVMERVCGTTVSHEPRVTAAPIALAQETTDRFAAAGVA